MSERVLTLKQVAQAGVVPLGESSLYRIARRGGEGSPFRKRGGRWMVVESDLLDWVREGQQGDANPMPAPKRSRAKDLLDEVQEIRRLGR